MDPHHQGNLLARDGIHHGLEYAREAGWSHAENPSGKGAKVRVVMGQSVETIEIDLEPQGAFDDVVTFRHRPVVEAGVTGAQVQVEPGWLVGWMPGSGSLAGSDLDGFVVHHQGPPVALAIPSIDEVVLSSPQRPYGQIEAERIFYLKGEAQLIGGHFIELVTETRRQPDQISVTGDELLASGSGLGCLAGGFVAG